MTDANDHEPPAGTELPAVVPPSAVPGMDVPAPHPVPGTIADAKGAKYDERVNSRRVTSAKFLFGAAGVTTLGIFLTLILVAKETVAPNAAIFIVASLGLLTAFLVASARRDLIPYQDLFPRRGSDKGPKTPLETIRDSVLEAAEAVKKIKSGD